MVPLHGACLLEVRAASLGRQDSGGLILSHLPSAPVASRYSPQSAAPWPASTARPHLLRPLRRLYSGPRFVARLARNFALVRTGLTRVLIRISRWTGLVSRLARNADTAIYTIVGILRQGGPSKDHSR
jgi:hypothetical protein